MKIEKLTKPSGVISALANQPKNLTAEQLKAKFDAVPDYILNYINDILIPAIIAGTPVKISQLNDDTLEYPIALTRDSMLADKAVNDENGNAIINTYATIQHVNDEIANLIDSSPEVLNTLNELSAALKDDPNHTETMLKLIGEKADKTAIPIKLSDLVDDTFNDVNSINVAKYACNAGDADRAQFAEEANIAQFAQKDYINNVIHETYATKADANKKVDKEEGKVLSSNDFTDEEKEKLLGIAEGAEVNIQPDWNEQDETEDSYIRNKPDLLEYATKEKLATKVDKEEGKGLSTNDFTNDLKARLESIVITNLGYISPDEYVETLKSYIKSGIWVYYTEKMFNAIGGTPTILYVDAPAVAPMTGVVGTQYLINISTKSITKREHITKETLKTETDENGVVHYVPYYEEVWTDFEPYAYLSDENFTATLKIQLESIPDTYATKEEASKFTVEISMSDDKITNTSATFGKIYEAYNQGKRIEFLVRDSAAASTVNVGSILAVNEEFITFKLRISNEHKLFICNSNNTWGYGKVMLERSDYKKESIDDTSAIDDKYYPTCNAVVDYVNRKIEGALEGDY